MKGERWLTILAGNETKDLHVTCEVHKIRKCL